MSGASSGATRSAPRPAARGRGLRGLRALAASLGAPLVALLLVVVVMSLTTDRFLTSRNLLNVALQVSIIAIIAIGSTTVILTGGIDLSPGSMVALLTMVLATLVKLQGAPLAAAVVAVVTFGAALGAVNGLLSAYGRMPSFVVTLATLSAYKGWAFLFNNGSPLFDVSPSLEPLFYGKLLGLPLPLYYVAALYGLAYLLLNYTAAGRAIYAVGGNESAARLSGISVGRARLLAFTLAGCMAGFASVLMTARLNSGSPNYGVGFELAAIAAAVIGGATLAGGSGNVLATLVGALTIVVVQNGLNLNNVPTTWQSILLGVIIVLAVAIDGWRQEAAGALRRLAGLLGRLRPRAGGPPGPRAEHGPQAEPEAEVSRPSHEEA
jgi:ribose transport system permease protein